MYYQASDDDIHDCLLAKVQAYLDPTRLLSAGTGLLTPICMSQSKVHVCIACTPSSAGIPIALLSLFHA